MTWDKDVTGGGQVPSLRDEEVTPEGLPTPEAAREDFERIRAEMAAAFDAAKQRVARRLRLKHADQFERSRSQAQDLVRDARRRARDLAGVESEGPVPGVGRPVLTPYDLHTLERLCSYVRHSIVRVCFYNLKLFCPSLIDEYDAHVKQEVLANIDQLPAARSEIVQFFEQALSDGRTIGQVFRDIQRKSMQQLDALIELATAGTPSGKVSPDRLDEEPVRRRFAQQAPALIDAVMDALQGVQTELDTHKIAVAEVVDQAVGLVKNVAEQAGLTVRLHPQPVPRVFGDSRQLIGCFSELVTNAARHSGATDLAIDVAPANQHGPWVEVSLTDNGRGMTPDELASCLTRGVSRGGTGEGLPMVVQRIEEEHLGEFEITAEPGQGCRARVRLPVKLDTRRGRRHDDERADH
jgi:signal transduction histidine kinase